MFYRQKEFVFFFSLVASIDAVKINDEYLQEQLNKLLNKTLDNHRPTLSAVSDFVRILFNNNNSLPNYTDAVAATTTNIPNESNILKVSYCYSTKEWRCLYRCEIDSSLSNVNTSKVGLTLFGSVNNPTEEDWSQVELVLVANELEILSNNKTTTAATGTLFRDEAASSGSGSSGGMQLFIKTLTGKTITIEVCINKDLFIYYVLFSCQ